MARRERAATCPLRLEANELPYVTCPKCGVRCFSAARWSNVDHCGACGADLPRRRIDATGRYEATASWRHSREQIRAS